MMRIATWNVNSLRVRLPHLAQWLAANPVDAIGLQELKLPDEQFPRAEIEALGLHAVHYGQKTYNGVAILARAAPADVTTGMPGDDDPQRRVIAATVAGVRLVNVYVPNGQEVGSEKYAYKLAWLERLRAWLANALSRHPRLAVVGDFNIAPEDRDVHDPAKWEGSVHVSAPEREALAANHRPRAHRPVPPLRAAGRRVFMVGLPHGRVSPQSRPAHRPDAGIACPRRCAARPVSSTASPRAWERPSDHAPVVASFDID